jgi:iron complex transport system substrate-binding protein
VPVSVRILLVLALIVGLAIGVTLCHELQPLPAGHVTVTPWRRPLEQRRHDPFPRRFVNAAGEEVWIQVPPQRIVSGTVFSDAVLLDACPRERIAALHVLSKDPRYSPVAVESQRFPRHVSGNPEEILRLEPDLVILSSFSREETRSLHAGPRCAVVRFFGFTSVGEIQDNLRALGYVLGLDDRVAELERAMDATLARVAEGRERRRRWRVLLYEANRTAGRHTTFGSLLTGWVGARNAADDLGIAETRSLESEQILAADPDALVLAAVPGEEGDVERTLRQHPVLSSLRAVKRGRLVFVPSGALQATSHHVAAAAQRIAEALDRWGTP